MDNDLLILANQRDYTILPFQSLNDVDLKYSFVKLNNVLRIIRRLWYIFHLPYFSVWLNTSNINMSQYKIIVIFECSYPLQIIKQIRKMNKTCKIIYWLWNPVKNNGKFYNKFKMIHNLIIEQKHYDFKIATFDKIDADKYDFVYLNQVAPYLKKKERKIVRDLIFIGKDKGRYESVKKICDIIKKNGKVLKAVIVGGDAGQQYPEYMVHEYDEMPYTEVIDYILESKCILDIVQKGQRGITWRPLEALFYKKKLITNFKDIKKYDFYSSNNIFVLGDDEEESLQFFFDKPMDDIKDSVINKYKGFMWVENIRKRFL